MNEDKKVPKRIAQTLINSLKGGVVPRTGLPYITVGRKNEIEALLHDVDIVAEGGASFRFIVGNAIKPTSFIVSAKCEKSTIPNKRAYRKFVYKNKA